LLRRQLRDVLGLVAAADADRFDDYVANDGHGLTSA
jgi:hypothetical protein